MLRFNSHFFHIEMTDDIQQFLRTLIFKVYGVWFMWELIVKSYGQFTRHGKFDCEIVLRVKINSTKSNNFFFLERNSYTNIYNSTDQHNISFHSVQKQPVPFKMSKIEIILYFSIKARHFSIDISRWCFFLFIENI